MKWKKLMKLFGICSCCVLLGGCAGVNARVQETETVVEETGQKEADVEETVTEAVSERNAETEQVLDQSPEIQTLEVAKQDVISETADWETEIETETESETASEEKRLLLKYDIEDQELEIGKCFDDITTPEYAEAEDGSKVAGKVEWRRPGGTHAFESDMVLTGADGDKRTWEWMFVPDEEGYESIGGTVEITMKNALSSDLNAQNSENDEMAMLKELWKKKEMEENAGDTSSSGNSTGASSVINLSDIKEVAGWMGSLMTGAGIIGDQKGNHTKEAGKGNVNVAHGTVVDEKEQVETNMVSETEAALPENPEKNTESVQSVQQSNTAESRTKNETENSTFDNPQKSSGLTCEETKIYGRYGMTAFALTQAVSQIVHGNPLK